MGGQIHGGRNGTLCHSRFDKDLGLLVDSAEHGRSLTSRQGLSQSPIC